LAASHQPLSPEEKYIRKLEHSLWLLKTSKSYRLTYPLRKGEEVLRAAARLPGALRQYVRPSFKESFDARCYLSSSARPHGWWRNFPAMHYCLFHENDYEEHGKYDSLDKARPTVLLITHSVCRTGAPILVLDLLNRFSKTHNTIVFAIGGGALENMFRKKANVFVGPIARSNLGFVLNREIRLLKTMDNPSFAVVNSIEATEALDELWRNDVPIVHLVHEFATYTRPRARIEKSATKSDAIVFSADIVRDNAIGTCAEIAVLEKHVMPQGICALPESSDSDEAKEAERAAIRQALRPEHLPQDTVVVLGAGTVQLRKGLHLFVSCAKKVREKDPDARIRFVWIGSGFDPEEDLNYSCFLDEQIKRSELGDSFTLLNEVHELQCAYDSADIFFLSSQLDPLPLVAQDALLNKLPLVCFDGASGLPGHIKQDDEASAGIVPYMDVDAAAEKILRLATDSELRKKTGDAGRRLAGRIFDQDKYFADLNRIGSKAAAAKKQEITDRKVIQESGCFDVSFAYPLLTDEPDLALKYYTSSWRKGFFRRKPFSGFHPGIYTDFHPDVSCDPLAHFVKSGKPAGPWLLESISAENQQKIDQFSSPPKAALHIHLHYPDVAAELFSRLAGPGFQPDLFLSVTSEESKRQVQARISDTRLKPAAIRVVPNRGRDIGPLLTGFPEIFSSGYEFVGHVHGKKSVNLGSEFARQWAVFLYENLLGGKAPMLDVIMRRMQADPTIGFVFPDDPHVVGWEANWSFAKELGERMGVGESLRTGSINFPVGTMFWARTRALEPFLKLNLQWEDYPQEPLPYDGSMLHAIERLLPMVCESQGFRIAVTHTSGVMR
jgi:glycosyltransferase involved in cell wall biosynthesis